MVIKMNQRPSKVRSLDIVSSWSYAELDTGRAKKIEKQLIKKKRRILEKREARKIINEYD